MSLGPELHPGPKGIASVEYPLGIAKASRKDPLTKGVVARRSLRKPQGVGEHLACAAVKVAVSKPHKEGPVKREVCLLYTSDAADE